jgi:hypothetical protein
VGWKRARKVCEKYWRGLENRWRGCDGTSAVIALASLTASTTMAFAADRAPDFRHVEERPLATSASVSEEQSNTNAPDIALHPRATGASVHTISAVRSSRRSAYRRISHRARQAIAGQPCASVTSVGIAVEFCETHSFSTARDPDGLSAERLVIPRRPSVNFYISCSLNSPAQTPVRARCAQDSSISSKSAKADRRRRTHIVVIGQADAVGPSITVR